MVTRSRGAELGLSLRAELGRCLGADFGRDGGGIAWEPLFPEPGPAPHGAEFTGCPRSLAAGLAAAHTFTAARQTYRQRDCGY